jgi:arginine deiminase
MSAAAAILGSAAAPYVDSEVGRLRSVLLHEPGAELAAVDPDDPGQSLFSRRVPPDAAIAEHRAFATVLRREGVEVLYLRDLLDEIASASDTRPLPNLMFMRDQSVWIGRGVAVGAMACAARRTETRLIEALYEAHPRFAAAPAWHHAAVARPRVEGGDVIVADERRVVVGIGARTTASGARRLAHALLAMDAVDEVATIRFPRRLGFHLDLVLTMVDRDAVAVRRGAADHLRAHLWRTGRSGIDVRSLATGLDAFPQRVRAIPVDEQRDAADPRAWDCGINVLALRPGRVLAYADNACANDQLQAAGVDVVPVSGASLAAGRGGPHCLTCTLLRDPV